MNKPIYKHDCSNCVFLGNYEKEGQEFDLYFCKQTGTPTVVARYGNEGHEYLSGMQFAIGDLFYSYDTPLGVALKEAYKANLIRVNIEAR